MPPRPSDVELDARATPLGPLSIDNGVVVQKGTYGSYWLRAGVIKRVPWQLLWTTLRTYVTTLLEQERAKERDGKIPGAVYVVISLRTMQVRSPVISHDLPRAPMITRDLA